MDTDCPVDAVLVQSSVPVEATAGGDTSVRVVRISASSIEIEWWPAVDDMSDLQQRQQHCFVAQAAESSLVYYSWGPQFKSSVVMRSAGSAAPRVTVSGLRSDTLYVIRVAAVDESDGGSGEAYILRGPWVLSPPIRTLARLVEGAWTALEVALATAVAEREAISGALAECVSARNALAQAAAQLAAAPAPVDPGTVALSSSGWNPFAAEADVSRAPMETTERLCEKEVVVVRFDGRSPSCVVDGGLTSVSTITSNAPPAVSTSSKVVQFAPCACGAKEALGAALRRCDALSAAAAAALEACGPDTAADAATVMCLRQQLVEEKARSVAAIVAGETALAAERAARAADAASASAAYASLRASFFATSEALRERGAAAAAAAADADNLAEAARAALGAARTAEARAASLERVVESLLAERGHLLVTIDGLRAAVNSANVLAPSSTVGSATAGTVVDPALKISGTEH